MEYELLMPKSSSSLAVRLRSYWPKDELFTLLILAAIVGVGGAFASLLFRALLVGARHALDPHDKGLVAMAQLLPWWGRLLLPIMGGIAGGLVLKFGLRWVRSRGTNDYLEAITIGDGVLSIRQSLIKSLSSLISVDSGASIGREGSMVQLAATFGSALGRLLKLPQSQLQLLVACGATAGITSAYNAPIAGTLFVVEIAMGNLSKATLGPLIVSSVVANVITRWVFHLKAVYEMPPFVIAPGWEVFAYAGLGIVCGFLAPVFRSVLDGAREGFNKLGEGLIVHMALGGVGVGLISIWVPDVWGNGYSVVNDILHNPFTWQALAAILFFKIIATALCAGSGAVGGVFTPTLFVGAALGALYGHVLVGISPLSDTSVTTYAIIGMGAFLASVTYAPLMSILMIFEMTLSYEAVLPLMLACVIGHSIAHHLRPDSIYGRAEPPVKMTGNRRVTDPKN
jgi:CIC family chloride channel protein